MGFILKIAAGAYIVSVLIFSSLSKASEGMHLQTPSTQLTTVYTNGVVREESGYLYFQTESNEILLIHSNSFVFFHNITLPQKVYIEGLSLNTKVFSEFNRPVLQITSIDFLK